MWSTYLWHGALPQSASCLEREGTQRCGTGARTCTTSQYLEAPWGHFEMPFHEWQNDRPQRHLVWCLHHTLWSSKQPSARDMLVASSDWLRHWATLVCEHLAPTALTITWAPCAPMIIFTIFSLWCRWLRPAASKSVACLQDSCDAGWSSPPSAKVSQGFEDKLNLTNQSSIRTASVGSDELNLGRKIKANGKKVSVRFGFEGSMLERLQGILEVNWSCWLRQLQVEEWFCEPFGGLCRIHHPSSSLFWKRIRGGGDSPNHS